MTDWLARLGNRPLTGFACALVLAAMIAGYVAGEHDRDGVMTDHLATLMFDGETASPVAAARHSVNAGLQTLLVLLLSRETW